MLRSKPLLWLACCLRGQFPKIAPIAKITQFFEFDTVTGFTNWVTDYTNWYARKSFITSSLMRFPPLQSWQPVCLLSCCCPKQDFTHGKAKFSQDRSGRSGNRFDKTFDQAEVCSGGRQPESIRRECEA